MPIDDAAHRHIAESAGLYAVGALDADERRAFEAHVRTCDACARELRSFDAVIAGLSLAVPQIDPPANLRERVTGARRPAAIGPVPQAQAARRNAGWLAAAALLIAALGLGGYTVTVRQEVGSLQQQLQSMTLRLTETERRLDAATQAVTGAELRMAVLMAPDLARIDLAGQPAAPRAAGRAFWSRARGLVFAASAMPALPGNRTYQVWVVTATQPISAGVVRPDPSGAITTFFATPPDIPPPVAVAVTIEPAGGVPAPTGDRYLVGPAH